ncbi:MAG: acyl-CoA thioesterase, partial [Comamonadaceae bacterium]
MVTVDVVWPDQANHHGTLFGGAALSILDRMAFIGASKALRGAVVTASVGKLEFLAPAPAGHLVECQVDVTRLGNRSATLVARLVAEDLLSGQRTDCLTGEFVMVRRADEPGQAPLTGASPLRQAVTAPVAERGGTCMACAVVAE